MRGKRVSRQTCFEEKGTLSQIVTGKKKKYCRYCSESHIIEEKEGDRDQRV